MEPTVILQWMPSHCSILGNETRHCGKGRCNKRAGGQLNSFTEAKTKSTPFTEAKTKLNTLHRGQDQAQHPSQRPRPSSTHFTEAKTSNLHSGQDQQPSQRPRPRAGQLNNFHRGQDQQPFHRGQDPAQHPSQRPRPCSTPFTEAKTMLNKLLRGQD